MNETPASVGYVTGLPSSYQLEAQLALEWYRRARLAALAEDYELTDYLRERGDHAFDRIEERAKKEAVK